MNIQMLAAQAVRRAAKAETEARTLRNLEDRRGASADMTKPDGGPAFPVTDNCTNPCNEGMSRRDYAAIHVAAIHFQLVYERFSGELPHEEIKRIAVEAAYDHADALIAEGKKGG